MIWLYRNYESIVNITVFVLLIVAVPVYYDYNRRENKFLLSQIGVVALLLVILFLPNSPVEFIAMCATSLCAGYALWEMRKT